MGKEDIGKLQELIEILKNELQQYSELIDIQTMLPKEKFVKYRLSRLINRARVGKTNLIGIYLRIEPEVSNLEEKTSIRNYIVNYIDSNIRPNDLLFLIEDNSSIGLVCIEESPEASKAIIARLNHILEELKLKILNRKVAKIKWSIRKTNLQPEDDVNSFLRRLKGEE